MLQLRCKVTARCSLGGEKLSAVLLLGAPAIAAYLA